MVLYLLATFNVWLTVFESSVPYSVFLFAKEGFNVVNIYVGQLLQNNRSELSKYMKIVIKSSRTVVI